MTRTQLISKNISRQCMDNQRARMCVRTYTKEPEPYYISQANPIMCECGPSQAWVRAHTYLDKNLSQTVSSRTFTLCTLWSLGFDDDDDDAFTANVDTKHTQIWCTSVGVECWDLSYEADRSPTDETISNMNSWELPSACTKAQIDHKDRMTLNSVGPLMIIGIRRFLGSATAPPWLEIKI